MSVILEALRKSEAERQRGRAPGLFVEQTVARSRRSGWSRAWPWLLIAVLVAVLAAWGWREWARPGPTVVVVESPAAVPVPVEVSQKVPLASQGAPEIAIPGPRDVEAPGRAGMITEATPAPSPAGRSEGPANPAVAPVPSVPATDTPLAPPSPGPDMFADDAPPVADKPVDAAPLESLPTVASLGASERAQLPPLKLSMHVYADEPAQRFVILDGQRLGEGASPAPGVVLEQIRRDGLVLSMNGQRLLLARP